MTLTPIAIIGAGNMGSSLIHGLINNGQPANTIWASDTNEKSLEDLKQRFNIHVTTNNVQALEAANTVILAVKPQIFSSVAKTLASAVRSHKPLIISIAAGIKLTSIKHWLGENTAIVRAMPNMPALIGCGATALYANNCVSPEQKQQAESILRAVGLVVWLANEELIDTVTALSGSGPAYFFLIMEILQNTAENLGLNPETAKLLTLQTAMGAARMALESDKSLEELRFSVTSPGGTTEKALSVFEENNIREVFHKALSAAKLRSEELAELVSKD